MRVFAHLRVGCCLFFAHHGSALRRGLHLPPDPAEALLTPAEVAQGALKLGLGDFVFYSVLVGKGSAYGVSVRTGPLPPQHPSPHRPDTTLLVQTCRWQPLPRPSSRFLWGFA